MSMWEGSGSKHAGAKQKWPFQCRGDSVSIEVNWRPEIKAAAKRFFKRLMRPNPGPHWIVTDQCAAIGVEDRDPGLVHLTRAIFSSAARLNNRAENVTSQLVNAHGACVAFSTRNAHKKFLSWFWPIRQHLGLKRHLIRASLCRKQLAARVVTWREFAELDQNPSTAF